MKYYRIILIGAVLFSLPVSLSGADAKRHKRDVGRSRTTDDMDLSAGYFVKLKNGKIVSRKEHKEIMKTLRLASLLENKGKSAQGVMSMRNDTDDDIESFAEVIKESRQSYKNLEHEVVKNPLYLLMKEAESLDDVEALSYEDATHLIAMSAIVDAALHEPDGASAYLHPHEGLLDQDKRVLLFDQTVLNQDDRISRPSLTRTVSQ